MRRFRAGRIRHQPGKMNKMEAKYNRRLEAMKASGGIAWHMFEPFKLQLHDAKGTTYTPDFAVMLPCGSMEIHEVKGYWEDDARVKIKVAASCFFMFDFIAITQDKKKGGGGWKLEKINPR